MSGAVQCALVQRLRAACPGVDQKQLIIPRLVRYRLWTLRQDSAESAAPGAGAGLPSARWGRLCTTAHGRGDGRLGVVLRSMVLVPSEHLGWLGLRAALATLPDLCVAGETGCGAEALALTTRLHPDL